MEDIKVGDRVHCSHHNIDGVVTLVDSWMDSGPLTVENHGSVNVLLDNGEEEHYCLINWFACLRKI